MNEVKCNEGKTCSKDGLFYLLVTNDVKIKVRVGSEYGEE